MSHTGGTVGNNHGKLKSSGPQKTSRFAQHRGGVLEVFQKPNTEDTIETFRRQPRLARVGVHHAWNFQTFPSEVSRRYLETGFGKIQHRNVAASSGQVHRS